jgi:sec-independent protein translocase protein TatA
MRTLWFKLAAASLAKQEVSPERSNNSCMGILQPSHWIILLIVVLLLFGGKKIPELLRGVGQGVGELQKGLNEAKGKLNESINEDTEPRSLEASKEKDAPAKKVETDTADV